MMNESIAKRYAKAIMEIVDGGSLAEFASNLHKVSTLFSQKKFVDIISSPDVSVLDKQNIIIESVTKPTDKFVNLVKLLSEKNRLEIIPEIAKQISRQIALNSNVYVGKLVTGFAVEGSSIEDIEKQLSKKFNSTVKLENEVKDFSGIKVELDEIGVEVSFSLDRLKSQMSEHILKAI